MPKGNFTPEQWAEWIRIESELVVAMERTEDGELPILLGEYIDRFPDWDTSFISCGVWLGISDRDLRDYVIYADERCLDRKVEQRRLDAVTETQRVMAASAPSSRK
jgi:hypothetical protein